MLLLTKAKVYYRGNLSILDVLIENQNISKVGPNLEAPADCPTIELSGKIILPGVIDMHVHFRIPGGEHKEIWDTGSKAAAAGGVTTVMDMPNCNPATTTLDLYREKSKLVEGKSFVNYGFYFGAGPDNRAEQKKLPLDIPIKCYAGPTTGSLLVDRPELLEDIFSASDHLFLVHAEDKAEMDKNAKLFEGQSSPTIHNKIRTPKAATIVIERILDIVRRTNRRTHFCHISSKEELDLIKQAKKGGLPISCEVTPHHLFLEEEALDRLGNFAKMNPPIRSQEHLGALWGGLLAGDIDCVATDHAPHTKEEKQQDYWKAPAGVPGVQTMLPLLLQKVNDHRLDITRLIEITSQNPARILSLENKGEIKEGFDADLTIIDLNKKNTIRNEDMQSKCGWTPFDGVHVQGWPVMTIVGGNIVCQDGDIPGKPQGKQLFSLNHENTRT